MTLLEAKKHLGGRAFSFYDKETGLLIDNCQHVLLGCCQDAIGFLTKIGSIEQVESHKKLNIIGSVDERFEIESSILPAPFHLLPSLVQTRYISTTDKLELAGVLGRMALKSPKKGNNARDYLKTLSCSQSLTERIIEPMLISALNEPADKASAKYARMVILKTLLGNKTDYCLGVPKVSLSELIELPVMQYANERGCEIRTHTRIDRVVMKDNRISYMISGNGEEIEADIYVCAVPPASLEEMGLPTWGGEHLIWRSIVSAHLFFDESNPQFDHTCVADEPFQWVFNKSKDIAYIQAVASAADDIVGISRNDTIDLAMRAVKRSAPELNNAKMKRAIIYRSKQATFSSDYTSDAFRPSNATHIQNLFLTGDWIATGWPATIESAVSSGQTAAKLVLSAYKRL